jgi:hypothetical protein
MAELDRITFDSQVMGGGPCIREMRVTEGTIVGLIASNATVGGDPRRLPVSGARGYYCRSLVCRVAS